MSNTPLPPEQVLELKHRFGDVVTVTGYGPDEMHAYASAVNAALREQVRVLREALIYHQDQTRPIEKTRAALEKTK